MSEIVLLDLPSVADWHEPVKYRHRVNDLVKRAVEVDTQELIDRAAALTYGQNDTRKHVSI